MTVDIYLDRPPYHTSSPPPNFQLPNQGTAPPFYVAGSEVPSHHHAPSNQQYPPREETPQKPPINPAPNTTSPPPQHYNSYSQTSGPTPGPHSTPYSQSSQQGGQPQSTYGAQELATSVYDSPIAPLNPQFSDAPNAPPPGPPAAAYAGQPQYQSYAAPDQAPPPVPTGQPPQIPQDAQPGLDSRQGLPSQQPQYKPYVPPGGIDGPSAPAPNDYYRSGVY